MIFKNIILLTGWPAKNSKIKNFFRPVVITKKKILTKNLNFLSAQLSRALAELALTLLFFFYGG
jgi:hypothetical protein